MSKIIEFEEKLNKLEEIPAGSTFTIIGQIGDQGMLKTKMVLPTAGLPEKEIGAMVNYNKRYVIAQAVDESMKRIQSDENLKDKPITLTISQELKPDDMGYKLETTIELGIAQKVQTLTSVSIQPI